MSDFLGIEMSAWWILGLIFIAGIVTGFINTLAGSGSLITLPVLMFAGLPANIANGTNRIGIFVQGISALFTFRKSKVFKWTDGTDIIIFASIGSIAGAYFALNINKEILEQIIGGLLLFMMVLMLIKPEKWVNEKSGNTKPMPSYIKWIVFLGIGIYGGFIQAGVGFFLLAGLVLVCGYDLKKANALKIFITTVYTLFALPVFILNDQINWQFGIALAAGSSIGAFIAAKLAVKKGVKFIRIFLLVILFLASLKLLNVDKLFN